MIRSLLVGAARVGVTFAFMERAAAAATVTVNTTAEQLGDHKCSLSEAITAVNRHASFDGCTFSGSGADQVIVPAGTYVESSTIFGTRSMTIQGAGIKNGIQQTQINGAVQGLPLFSFNEGSSAIQVTINGVELLNAGGSGSTGVSGTGNYDSSKVSLVGCWVFSFDASGIDVSGLNLHVEDSILEDNSGGGIVADNNLTILNTSVVENSGGGVLFFGSSSGTSDITNSTLAYNMDGPGLYLANIDEQPTDLFTINASTIAFNSAPGASGVRALALNYKVNASIISNNNDGTNEADWTGNIASLTNSALKSSAGATIASQNHNLINTDPMLFAGTNLNPLWIGGAFYPQVVPLTPGSPAIDFISSVGGTDQRHFPRGIAGGSGRSTLFDIGAIEMDPHIQGETLVVIPALTGAISPTTVSDSNFSNGQASRLAARGTSDFVTYQVPIQHDLTIPPVHASVRVKKGPDEGIFQLFWSERASPGTLHSLGTVDLFSSTAAFTTVTLPNAAALSTDAKYFKFQVIGKNSRSTGFNIYVDYIDFN